LVIIPAVPSWLWYAAGSVLALIAVAMVLDEIGAWRDRRRYPPPGQLVRVGRRRIHVRVVGRGTPTVVLEAGSGEWSSHWNPVIDALSSSMTVVAYDRAGLGWSDPGRPPRSCAAIAADLDHVLAALDLPGPYILVGHSSGAIFARYFAHTRPDATAGLVLVDPFCENMEARFQAEGVGFPDPPRWLTAVQVAITRLGVPRLMQALAPAPANDPVGPEVSHKWLRPVFLRATALEAAAGKSCDEELISVRERSCLPVRVLTARETMGPEFAPSEAFRDQYNRIWVDEHTKLLAWFDDARHTIVDGVDHMIQLRDPAVVAEAISDVAGRVDARRTSSRT
jgi:pimeloyl-ACP methyl ester carboxylesterase